MTPKTRQEWRPQWRLVWPQLTAMALLAIACVVGAVRLALGTSATVEGTLVNVAWAAYDPVVLSVIITAARYRGYESERQEAS